VPTRLLREASFQKRPLRGAIGSVISSCTLQDEKTVLVIPLSLFLMLLERSCKFCDRSPHPTDTNTGYNSDLIL
jgi:hypothetical protein